MRVSNVQHRVSSRNWTTVAPKYQPDFERDVLDEMKLAYWSVSGFQHSDPHTVDARFERKGWIGITVTNFSPTEERALRDFAKAKGPEFAKVCRKEECGSERWCAHFLGEYKDYCMNFWFATRDVHDEFVALLEAFPKRSLVLMVKNWSKIQEIVGGTNFKLIHGEEGTAVGVTTEISKAAYMKLRLYN